MKKNNEHQKLINTQANNFFVFFLLNKLHNHLNNQKY